MGRVIIIIIIPVIVALTMLLAGCASRPLSRDMSNTEGADLAKAVGTLIRNP